MTPTMVFLYGPEGQVIGKVQITDAFRLCKEADCNLNIDVVDHMKARMVQR